MSLIGRLLVNAAALWAATHLLSGMHYTGAWTGLLGVALVFGLVNTFIRPILSLLSFPIQLVTLGLFTLVLNAGMLLLTARLARAFGLDFRVDGFVTALLGAVVISLVSMVLNAFVAKDDD